MFNYGITDTDNLLQFTRELEEQFPELSEEYKEIVPISRLSTGATWIHTNKSQSVQLMTLKA